MTGHLARLGAHGELHEELRPVVMPDAARLAPTSTQHSPGTARIRLSAGRGTDPRPHRGETE